MEGEQQPHRGGGDAATTSLLQDQQPPRNKRRAGEFDPLLLSRLASLSACSDDEASDKTAVWPPVSAHDEPAPLSAHNVAADLLPSACVDDGDDEWLSFPVVPTHVPVPSLGAAFASSSPAPPFSLASSSTSVTSSSSGAVPTRGKAAARRYSIAVSSTALRDYAGPRPTNALASAASALPPCSSASPSSSSASAARMAPHNRGRAPTGPLPLPPAGPQPVSVSTTAAAAAALRKESKGEADYQKLRELALKEDFHDLEKRQALYKAGRDTLGRQVVVFTLYNLGDKVDFDRLLLYIIRVMDKLVEEEYALVFCQTHMTTAHRPPFTWLRKAYSMFQRKYKKNLKAAYIIHASTLVRMTLKLFKPFISSKFWKKLVYIDQVTDIYQYIRPDQLTLPDEVLTYNRESRATPLFGLPLAAGCARNLTASSLPIVCERAFEVLDARAVEVEGIFRVSGSTALLNELKQRFDRGEDVDLGFADVHTVAGLLKLYLRELPEPLMTFRLYEPFIAAVRRSREWDETRSEIQALVQELPAENYVLSARLYTLLGRVGANADKNLMNVNNLAIVVGPNVMRAPPDAPADRMITDAGAVNTLVKLLIQHCHVLFPPDTEALL